MTYNPRVGDKVRVLADEGASTGERIEKRDEPFYAIGFSVGNYVRVQHHANADNVHWVHVDGIEPWVDLEVSE